VIIATGSSDHTDSATAGAQCGARALAQSEQPAALALAFCGGRHQPEAFLAGLRNVVGDVPVIGGAGVGAMADDVIGASGYECALALFPRELAPPLRVVEALEPDDHAAGRRLAERLLPDLGPDSAILLFYDSVRAAGPPPVLHMASRLVDGLHAIFDARLGDAAPTIIGGGTLCDFELTGGYVFDGDSVRRHAAVAVVLPDALRPEIAIMHGCTPASAFLEITRIQGPTVYELDGRPAVEVLAEKLGIPRGEFAAQRVSLAVTLGEKHGDPFAPFEEGNYVNRLVVSGDPESGAITLFEADFKAGSKVQLMVTDAERMCASVDRHAAALLQRSSPEPPVLALYIDCAGRASAFSASPTEEAGIVRQHVHGRMPWLGFYSGVELAPLLGRTRPLDWTGVLTVFRLRRGRTPPIT
jgi:hypothetical protein